MPDARTLLPSLALLGLLGAVAYRLRERLAAALPGRAGARADDAYRCDCGETLRMTGAGRHRIYWNGDDALLENACPQCARPLPAG